MQIYKLSLNDSIQKSIFTGYLFTLLYTVFTPKNTLGNQWFDFLGATLIFEVVINILLLIPLAYFLGYFLKRISLTSKTFVISLTSLLIEFLQQFIPGRVTDIRDFTLNILGAFAYLIIQNRTTRIGLERPISPETS